jgi:hypothetical protein
MLLMPSGPVIAVSGPARAHAASHKADSFVESHIVDLLDVFFTLLKIEVEWKRRGLSAAIVQRVAEITSKERKEKKKKGGSRSCAS